MKDINTVAFAKLLRAKNYTNKQISLITKMSAADISKIVNNKIYKDILQTSYMTSEKLETNKKVLDTILECKEIAGHGTLSDNDKYYIKLIKICGGNYQDVRELYYDRPIDELRPAWDYANQFEYSNFDAGLIGLTENELNDFLNN
jgi:hypothetical protein